MKKLESILISILIILIIITGTSILLLSGENNWAFVGKASQQQIAKVDEKIKIGIALPLTGFAAREGKGALEGIILAKNKINQNGGLNGKQIELVIEDSKCSATAAATITNKFVNVDEVDAIIGFICSGAVSAALPLADHSKTPVIFFGSAPGLTNQSEYAFRTYPSDKFEAEYAAKYAIDELGKKNIAILYMQNDYGKGLQTAFKTKVNSLGGTVVIEEPILSDTKDLKTILLRIKKANPDLIYFVGYPSVAVNGIKQIKEMGIDIPILGSAVFVSEGFVNAAASENVKYITPRFNNQEEFKNKIKSYSVFSPVGYDTLQILANAIKISGEKNIKQQLEKTNYIGSIAYTKISFDETGDLKNPVFEVMQIKNKTAVKITN